MFNIQFSEGYTYLGYMNAQEDKNIVIGFFSRPQTSRLVFLLSLLSFFYWFGALTMKDVYKDAFIGAVYEILWLPMLLLLIIIPAVAMLILIKTNNKKLFPVLSILLMLTTFIVLSRIA